MSWIEIGDTTKGVLLGGGITLATTYVVEWQRGRVALRQQKELFTQEASEARKVAQDRNTREDELTQAESERAKELAANARADWVFQQMWELRVVAYNGILVTLAQVEAGFQTTMNHALNPRSGEDVEERRSDLEQAQLGLDALAATDLYLNDRSNQAIRDYRGSIHSDLIRLSELRAKDPRSGDLQLAAAGVAQTREVIVKVRQEGREHLGDKLKSLIIRAEDAVLASQGK